MNRNACLPDSDKMSGKGTVRAIPREACDSAGNPLDPSNHPKVGRKTGRKNGRPSPNGIRMTAPIRDSILKTGVALYLAEIKHSVSDTYIKWKEKVKKDLSPDNLPTLQAFYAVLVHDEEVATTIQSRHLFGRKKKTQEPTLESTSTRVPGPGFRYQIDSTPSPGRVKFALADEADTLATVYLVIDTACKGIAGYYIGTKPACAELAFKAFLNATEDKIAYCLLHGIEITRAQWPMSTVPDELVHDRGELIGPVADILVSHYGVNFDNTPAYSPKLKSDVEAAFGSLMRRLIYKIDDHLPRRAGRKIDADDTIPVLIMKELHVLVILSILAYNSRMLDRAPSPSEVRRQVKLTPNGVWNSEHDRRRGEGVKFTPDELRMVLTKRGKARLDINGLQFEAATYVCDADGVKEFQGRLGNRSRAVPIYYDEDITDRVYVQTKVLKRLGIKTNLPHHKFVECSLHTNNADWAGYTFPRMREDMRKHNQNMQDALKEKEAADAALLGALAKKPKAKPPTPIDETASSQSSAGTAAKIENAAADARLAEKPAGQKPDNDNKPEATGPAQEIESSTLGSLRAGRRRKAK